MTYDNRFAEFLVTTLRQPPEGVYSDGPANDVPFFQRPSNPQPSPEKTMTDLTRQEVEAKLAQNKAEVDARLANFDTSVKTGFAELKVEIQKMRGDFEKQSHDSTKWIIGSVFGMISLAVAVIGVMINLNKADKPASAPTSPPMPIIITVPGVTAAPAPPPK